LTIALRLPTDTVRDLNPDLPFSRDSTEGLSGPASLPASCPKRPRWRPWPRWTPRGSRRWQRNQIIRKVSSRWISNLGP